MTVVAFDPLRDARHRDARAARECADWLAHLELEGKAERTLDDYERTVAVLLRALPEAELSEITDGDLAHLLRQWPAPSRRVRRAHLNSFFSWAYRMGRLEHNPMGRVPNPRAPSHKVAGIFTDEEVVLLEALPSPDGPLFALLFGAGLRKAEARNLRRSHISISLDATELVVYGGKGGKDRVVPLPHRVARALANLDLLERLDREHFMWYSRPGGGKVIDRSRPIGAGTFHRWYARGIAAAGVRYLKPHSTRHTYATMWRRLGLDLDELQLLLGHASIQTTSDLYVHTTVTDVARKIAAIEAGL